MPLNLRSTGSSSLRILVACPFLPRPDLAEGDRRLHALLKLLSSRHRVHLWCARHEGAEGRTAEQYACDLREIGVAVFPGTSGCLTRAIAGKVYDVAVFEFWHCAESELCEFRRAQPWAYTIIDTVDVHFLREETGLAHGIGCPKDVTARKDRELAIYRQADCVVLVTQEDRLALQATGGIRTLAEVPLVVTIRPRPKLHRRASLLFVGGFRHIPNVDGITWFVREIFPLVRQSVPGCSLVIVGSNASPEVQALGSVPGVEFVGYVPETDPYLDRASVSVAPLRFGAGMKGKVTGAMAAGVPVVTTSVGAQGLGAESGVHLLIADMPAQFADQVITLLRDPSGAEGIGSEGQRLVDRQLGLDAVAGRLDDLLSPTRVKRAPTASYLRSYGTAMRAFAGRIRRSITPRSVRKIVSRFRGR